MPCSSCKSQGDDLTFWPCMTKHGGRWSLFNSPSVRPLDLWAYVRASDFGANSSVDLLDVIIMLNITSTSALLLLHQLVRHSVHKCNTATMMPYLFILTLLLTTTPFCLAFAPSAFVPLTIRSSLHQKPRHHSSTSTVSLCMMADTKYKKIFVAGGSRGVGRAVIDKLLSSNDDGNVQVVALVPNQ